MITNTSQNWTIMSFQALSVTSWGESEFRDTMRSWSVYYRCKSSHPLPPHSWPSSSSSQSSQALGFLPSFDWSRARPTSHIPIQSPSSSSAANDTVSNDSSDYLSNRDGSRFDRSLVQEIFDRWPPISSSSQTSVFFLSLSPQSLILIHLRPSHSHESCPRPGLNSLCFSTYPPCLFHLSWTFDSVTTRFSFSWSLLDSPIVSNTFTPSLKPLITAVGTHPSWLFFSTAGPRCMRLILSTLVHETSECIYPTLHNCRGRMCLPTATGFIEM